MLLLDQLIKDEKKVNRALYSSGPYWDYKNTKAVSELRKKGLSEFRGINSGVGSSFADNLVFDIGNELNLRGKLIRKIFSLPILKIIFNSQLKITKNYIDLYLNNRAIALKTDENVIKLLEKYDFNNTVNFGCVQKFNYKEKEYSTIYLEMADRINKLSSKFDFGLTKTFFEIGGGFGSNIHFLITNFPNIKKIIYLDIVPNIYVGTEYLKYHFKENVIDYLQVKDKDEIKFSDNDDLEIICIPPWLIEKVKVEIDHFHNAASFVEMPKKVVKNYAHFINSFNTKEISLFSYGNYDLDTTFNPEELNIFFNNQLNISWKSSLLHNENKKNIFLTSK